MTENNEGISFPVRQVIELLENEPELLAIAFDQPLKFHARFATLQSAKPTYYSLMNWKLNFMCWKLFRPKPLPKI
ncbi:hypothetical protein [Dehalococcoides mccartyi]|uniref:hypothetical protein n=1 Tax=Dehalococcoides mccartyi TaxID=61435 RepID=UPI001EE6BBA0|nr:hypothetical protein [Dehalococcoides mccartyi]